MGRLSLLHEPLIIVFDQLEMLGLEHNRAILLNFGEAVKEIFTRVPYSLIIFNLFSDRWQQLKQTFDGSIVDRISQYQIRLEPPTTVEIKAILQLKAQAVNSDLNKLFTEAELQQIIGNKNYIRRILNNAAEYFRYKYKNIPLPQPDTEELIVNNVSAIETRLDRLESQQQRIEQLLTNIGRSFNSFIAIEPETSQTNTEENDIPVANSDLFDPPPNLKPTLEDKVIDYLTTQQEKLEQDYNDSEILLDEKDVGKLVDIIEAFKQIARLETDVLRSRKVFPPHRLISNKNLCIAYLSDCKSSKFTSRIQNFNQAVATREEIKFILWRDVRSDEIKPKTVGAREIGKLNNTKNGEFKIFDRHNRIIFELLYKFISDIHNRDLATEFQQALKIAGNFCSDYWLIQELL